MKKLLLFIFVFVGFQSYAQISSKNFRSKAIQIKSDTIQIDSVSINPQFFKVYHQDKLVDSTQYYVDFSKSLLILKDKNLKNIVVEYLKYPDFLTKDYFKFDENIIVPTSENPDKLYAITTNKKKNTFKPFDGLSPSGHLTRGITVGNNQDAVLNSSLDLKLSGKLSEKVTLRASILDTNIPIQENGYTQQLNEFDKVFIELYSKDWSLKAGNLFLENNESYFMKFNKKVDGISIDATLNNQNSKTSIIASGAVVKGKFISNQFVGIEGNQGPYKLNGTNGESFIIIVAGSEQIYANGILLKRGEENDYTIDYNTAEITFTTIFPITADMRLTAEYQYTDRSYTRFVTHNGVEYKTDKLTIGGYFYNENDLKNQPLQQDLTDEQKQLLALAGNDPSKMVSPSSEITTFSENKTLYKKTLLGSDDIYEYSSNPDDELYNVKFSFVGNKLGNYQLKETIAFGKIYEYVGVNLGDYNPVIQLKAPTKLQFAVVNAAYNPSEKTAINTEIAYSKNDQNLFSEIDDENSNGLAAKLNWTQTIFDNNWALKSNVDYENIHENFKSIERFESIEYDRNWNLLNPIGNKQLINTSLELSNKKNGTITYGFEQLKYSDSFSGSKHNFISNLVSNKLSLDVNSSFLKSDNSIEKTSFPRLYSTLKYDDTKKRFGVRYNFESNERKYIATNQLTNLSHRFLEYEAFFGIGDTSNVYSEIGYLVRKNDSLQNNTLQEVNNSNTYYLKSKLINNKNTQLGIYANYRTVNYLNSENKNTLNSRISYNQQLFNQFLRFNTLFETLSGSLAQQEYTYIETEAGHGYFTWNDYNNNGIKEIEEFEIAQFQDEAKYLRVALPNVNYLQTHQSKLNQTVVINPAQWTNLKGVKKAFSHFYNQSFLLIDNKQKQQKNSFNINPFDVTNDNLLGLNFNFKNSLYFNRGKQHYSITYNYLKSRNLILQTFDNLESTLFLNELQFQHKIGKFWLLDFTTNYTKNENTSNSYFSRNYYLKNKKINPKISYILNKDTHFDLFYDYQNKNNTIGNLEFLKSHQFGTSYHTANKKGTSFTADFNFYINNFDGNPNSPAAYQMLEGLQPGNNYTWSVLFYQKLNSFLNLNLNYLGRKSETSSIIHTGNVQLRASF